MSCIKKEDEDEDGRGRDEGSLPDLLSLPMPGQPGEGGDDEYEEDEEEWIDVDGSDDQESGQLSHSGKFKF